MGYYDNPDRIMIGVDITTLTDVFEENYREDNGKDFDWNKDGDRFNEASRELDVLIENVFVKMFGQAIAESYDDDTYVLTFWGDRNNPNDIKTLQELQGRADDTWRDNDRVQLAIYDTEFYTGNQTGKFADKWGDIGKALVDAITVGVDFPEEFDSDPMYEKVNGMSIKNSKQIKSSHRITSTINTDELAKEIDVMCDYAIDDMGGDEDAMFFSIIGDDSFLLKGHYIDNVAEELPEADADSIFREVCSRLGILGLPDKLKAIDYMNYQLKLVPRAGKLSQSRKITSNVDMDSLITYMFFADYDDYRKAVRTAKEHGYFKDKDSGDITKGEWLDILGKDSALAEIIYDIVYPYEKEGIKADSRDIKHVMGNSRKITSAKSGEVDPVAADELALCTVNDGDLYRQMTTPIITNLKKKIKNGTYDKELALKAWLNLVTVEARKYVKEFGSRGDTIDKMFNLNTRKEAAKQVAEHYEDALNE